MGLGLVDKPHLRRFKVKFEEKLNSIFVKKTDIATTSNLGIVQPDGTTITVDGNGVISGASTYELPTASTSTLGGVKIDGTTVTIDGNGVISATASGGSSVTWIQTQADGTKIAEIDVDGTSQDVYVPTVEANPQTQATGTLTKLQVGDDVYEISGGGGSSTLADLTDTDISSPSDNQDLVYDNTSSKWKNKTTKIFITQSDYDALSYAEKHNGCLYYITDAGHGSEKFTPIGLGECYSTEERMVGCWTDGKPLYQKTWVTNNATTGSEVNIDVSSLNIDRCVDIFGEYTRITGGYTIQYEFNTFESTGANLFGWLRHSKTAGNITYFINLVTSNHETTNYQHITMRYTKTTDTAGSGAWTPSGMPAVHYSTSEQIIGTWVDGKTLYQATVIIDNPTKQQSGSKYYYDTTYTDHNIDYVQVMCVSVYDARDSRWYDLPYNRIISSEDIACQKIKQSNGNFSCTVHFGTSQNYNITKIVYTLQYTKTS